MAKPSPTLSIAEAARAVLLSSAPREKVTAARQSWRAWRSDELAHRFDVPMPSRPARRPQPKLLPASRMPARRKLGSERSRAAMLHALAHIEFSAIDLAFDIIGRFGAGMPRAFVDDWVRVGAEEAMHFVLLDRHLRNLGCHYGSLPAHDGLWEAAEASADDLLLRLALVPMVLEARGLDVTPPTIARFEAAGDSRAAAVLRRIYEDEVLHVRAGTKWFEIVAESRGFEPISTWQGLIKNNFRGRLKPPFNDSARTRAGLSREYYAGVAAPKDV